MAALLVFGNHVGDVALTGRDDGGATWLSVGRVGVSFFFILSGFVLAWSGAAAVGLGTFYLRRIARIVPIHVVTWLFAIVVLMASGDVLGWTGGVLSLSLLQAWASDPSVHFAANSVSWSLSCELFFYASFPFIVMLFERMRSAGRHTAIGALVVATVVVPFVAAATLPEATAGWAVYVLPLTRLTEFALGVLLALQLRAGRLPRIRAVHACVAVAVAYALATIVPPVHRPAAVTLVPFALLIVGAAQQDLLGRRSWMSSHWLVRLGEWSFAFYLVHRAALTIVDEVIGFSGRPMPVVAVLVAASLGLGVAFAYTLHTSVERPAERLLRGPSRGGVQWTPWRAWIPWSVGPKALTGSMVTAAIIVSAVVVGLTPPSHHVAAAPYLIPLADGVEIVPLVTVGDAANLDDGYRFVGGGEGLGAADGGSDVIVYADHDLRADQGSTRRHGQSGAFVSRLVMDRDTLAITSGSDLIDPGVEFWDYPSGALVTREPRFADGTPQDIRFSRFNSGQLTTIGQLHNPRSGRGYEGRLFFANEENGDSARVFGITEDGQATMLPRLGLFSRENTAVATNRDDTTMIIGNEDASSGQLWVYVGAKQNHGSAVDRAGLTNGDLFVVAAVDPAVNTDAKFRASHAIGDDVPVDLVPVAWDATGSEQNSEALVNGLAFTKVTDGRFDPRHPNDYYFVTTERGDTAPGSTGERDGGGLWRLRFIDVDRPQLGANLVLLLDGSEDLGNHEPRLDSPDNMTIDMHGTSCCRRIPTAVIILPVSWPTGSRTARSGSSPSSTPDCSGRAPTSTRPASPPTKSPAASSIRSNSSAQARSS